MTIPGADLARSPYTGWTRDHWVAQLAGLTLAFATAAEVSGSPARPRLPGAPADDRICGLEGFARMSVAWGSWLGLSANPTVLQGRGRRVDVAELMVRGLLDGSDPGGPWWWGEIGDRDQRIVEAAEIATGLWLGRDRLVSALGRDGLNRLLDWLGQVEGRGVYPDNWILFPSFVATIQRGLGRHVPDASIDRGLDEMIARYRGDGWYADGPGHAFDQYTGWAIHWHLLLWARVDGDRRSRLRALIERRARTYLRGILPQFAADGSRPLYGRSLGYRFAAVAPFALAELLALGAVPPGLARRISSGTIARHLEDGAVDPATGWFRRGVGGERPEVCERYMSAGASAWAAHALVALGLGETASFWTEVEGALPVEISDGWSALRGPGFLFGRRRRTGETWLVNAVGDHPDDIPGHDYTPYYGKFVYRSHFPFTVRSASGKPGPDATVSFTSPDATNQRAITDSGAAGPSWTWSHYTVQTGPFRHRATTVVLPWRDVEVRLTGVRPGGPVRLSEAPGALGTGFGEAIQRTSSRDAGWEAAASVDRSVAIRRLEGYDSQDVSGPHGGGPDRNLVAGHAEQPVVAESMMSARPRIVAAACCAIAEPVSPIADLLEVEVRCLGHSMAVVSLGGLERAAVVLSQRPKQRLDVDGWTIDGPGLRVVRIAVDGSWFAGETIGAIAGVVRLERPGPISLRRVGTPALEAIVDTGFVVDRDWAGFEATALDVRDPLGTWRSLGRLEVPSAVSAALVRRLRRTSGRSLVELRLRP